MKNNLDLVREIKIAHLSGLVEKDKDGLIHWKNKYGTEVSLEIIEEEHSERFILRFYVAGKVNRSVEYEKEYVMKEEKIYKDEQMESKVTFDRSKRLRRCENGRRVDDKIKYEHATVYITYDENHLPVKTRIVPCRSIPFYKDKFENPTIVIESVAIDKYNVKIKKIQYYKGKKLIHEDEGEEK